MPPSRSRPPSLTTPWRAAHARTGELNDDEKDALFELLSTVPATLPGLTVLVSYLPTTQFIRDHGLEHGEQIALLETLAASLASIRGEA